MIVENSRRAIDADTTAVEVCNVLAYCERMGSTAPHVGPGQDHSITIYTLHSKICNLATCDSRIMYHAAEY